MFQGDPMRSDMAKVIVERPRHGSRMCASDCKGRRREERQLGLDALRKREGIKYSYHSETKSLNEHLGPLRRFLDSRVGQQWDQVFAEISARIRPDSAVQDHVRDHVFDYVQRHVVLIDGVPCSGEGRFYGRPLHKTWRRKVWYVCPQSGMLKRLTLPIEHPFRPKKQEAVTPRPVRVDEQYYCEVIGDRWCLVEVRPIPKPAGLSQYKAWEESCRTARAKYGAAVEAVSHRPLSKSEMRQLPVPVDLWKQRRWWTKPRKAKRA
jgi:hypothetical protein